MSKLLFLFGAILILTTAVTAQTGDFREKYNKDVITVLRDRKFILNNKKVSRNEIRDLLLKYPASAAEYRLFQKKKKIVNVLAIISIGLYCASFPVLENSDAGALGLVGGAVAVAIAEIPLEYQARRHLLNAVFLYNREMLAETK